MNNTTLTMTLIYHDNDDSKPVIALRVGMPCEALIHDHNWWSENITCSSEIIEWDKKDGDGKVTKFVGIDHCISQQSNKAAFLSAVHILLLTITSTEMVSIVDGFEKLLDIATKHNSKLLEQQRKERKPRSVIDQAKSSAIMTLNECHILSLSALLFVLQVV